VYSCRILLTSPNDIRVVTMEGTSLSLFLSLSVPENIVRFLVERSDVGLGMANIGETQAALDFRTTARQTLSQDIPIINNTSTAWVIKVCSCFAVVWYAHGECHRRR
jgi:hypothetical protein